MKNRPWDHGDMTTARPKMEEGLRAKQFMPFAAVTGLEAALRQKEKEIESDCGIINRDVYNEVFREE